MKLEAVDLNNESLVPPKEVHLVTLYENIDIRRGQSRGAHQSQKALLRCGP